MHASGPVTVFKLGGSLLDLPDLVPQLRGVLSQRPDSRPLLIVGGGAAADVVRRWDAIHGISNEAAHWLAIRAMALNERLLASVLAESVVVSSRVDAEAVWSGDKLPILCCFEFLRAEETGFPDKERLPRRWNATSDSIAAWVARRWPAQELLLVKSCDAASGDDPVDPLFATAATGLPHVGWVNLRQESPEIVEWQPRDGIHR